MDFTGALHKMSGSANIPGRVALGMVLQNKERAVIDRAYSYENTCSIVGAVYDRPLFFRQFVHTFPWPTGVACLCAEGRSWGGAVDRRARGTCNASGEVVFFQAGQTHEIGSRSLLSLGGAGRSGWNPGSPDRSQAFRQRR